MDTLTKRSRRLLRETADLAHERELGKELDKVLAKFEQWKCGEITPYEVSNEIHQFHDGPARQLYFRRSGNMHDVCIAAAVRHNLMRLDEVPADIRPIIEQCLADFATYHAENVE